MTRPRIIALDWVAFVTNRDDRPEWPRYDLVMRNVLDFTNTGVTFAANPLRARLDLWQSVWEQGR